MIRLYFDGGADPNPGKGYGSWETTSERDGWVLKGKWNGHPDAVFSCNQTEYITLVKALEQLLVEHPIVDEPLTIYSDSKLVVNQVAGRWRVAHPNMKELFFQIMALREKIVAKVPFTIRWNSRQVNVEKFGH